MPPVTFRPVTRILKQPDFSGVAVGTATGKVIAVGTHHAYRLRFLTSAGVELTRAEILADVSDITVRVDGEALMDADATFFLDLQKYYGDAYGDGNVDGCVRLPWTRRTMGTFQERAVYALGLAYNPKTKKAVQSITIDVKIIGVVKVAKIELYAEIEDVDRPMGQHIRIARHPQSWGTTGDQEIPDLPKEGDQVGILALHITKNAGTFNWVTSKLNGQEYDDQVPLLLQKEILAARNRAAQTGYFHLDYARHDDLVGYLPMAGARDYRVKINWKTAAPTAFSVYSERVFGLGVQ